MVDIKDSDNREVAYKQSVAEDLREWLSEAQKLWNRDMMTDLEIMLDGLEQLAEKYRQARQEERIRIQKQEELDDAEFVIISQDVTDIQDDWEEIA